MRGRVRKALGRLRRIGAAGLVCLVGVSCLSAPAVGEEEWPVLTDVVAEPIEFGVRLHFVVDGILPVTQDFSFSDVPKILLDPKGVLITSLPTRVPVEYPEILSIELIKDPTVSLEGLSPGNYPVDMIVLQCDRPRAYWVLTLGTELVVDVGGVADGKRTNPPVEDGREVTSPEEAGLTKEELQGMLYIPLINPLPQPPIPPAASAPSPARRTRDPARPVAPVLLDDPNDAPAL